jgi:hypothetical protein
MSTPIVHREASLEEIRKALREAPLAALREMLPDRKILEACESCGHEWRERLYGPIPTVLHFLVQAVQRDESFAATWQELSRAARGRLPGDRLRPAQQVRALPGAKPSAEGRDRPPRRGVLPRDERHHHDEVARLRPEGARFDDRLHAAGG